MDTGKQAGLMRRPLVPTHGLSYVNGPRAFHVGYNSHKPEFCTDMGVCGLMVGVILASGRFLVEWECEHANLL